MPQSAPVLHQDDLIEESAIILLWLLYQKQFSIFLVHLVSLKKYLYLCSLSGLIIFALINLVHIWK